MTVLADLTARFRADTADLEGGLGRVNQGVDQLKDGASSLSGILGAVGVAGATGLGILVDKIADATFSYNTFNQQALITFSAIEGGTVAAQNQIDAIDKLSVSLGVNREQLSNAAKYLQLMTDGAHNNTETLTKLTNAADATGQPVEYLAQRFGYLFQQLEQGGGSASYAARSLQLSGVITAQTAQEVKGLAEAGASASDIWNVLIRSLDRFSGAAEATKNTWQGLKASIHDTFEIDFGKSFEPVFASLNRLLGAVRDFTDSPLFHDLSTKIASGVESALGPIDHLTQSFEDWFRKLDASSVDNFLHKLEQLSGTLGAISGVFSKFGVDLLARLPVLDQLLTPLVSKFTGVTGAVGGFLLANKDTRDAIVDLLKALGELAINLAKATSGFADVLNSVAPIAAAVIEAAAAVIHFISTTGPLLAMAEVAAKLYVTWKAFETLQGLWESFTAKIGTMVSAHTGAVTAATAHAAAESEVALSLNAEAEAATAAAAAQSRLAASRFNQNLSAYAAGGTTPSSQTSNLSAYGDSVSEVAAFEMSSSQTRFGSAIDSMKTKAGELTSVIGDKFSTVKSSVTAMGATLLDLAPEIGIITIAAQGFASILDDVDGATNRLNNDIKKIQGTFKDFQDSLSSGGQITPQLLQSELDDGAKKLKEAHENLMGAQKKNASDVFDFGGGGQSPDEKKKIDAAKQAISDIQKAVEGLKGEQANYNQVIADTGATWDAVTKAANDKGINLATLNPKTDTGQQQLHQLEDALRGVQTQADKDVSSLNTLQKALDNISSGLKGEAGNQHYTFPTDFVDKIPGDIQAKINTINPNLLGQARALQGSQSQTIEDAQAQMQSFDKGQQALQLQRQQIQAAQAYTDALHNLAKAQQSYADAVYNANKAVEMAQRSLADAQQAYADAVKSTAKQMEQALRGERDAQEALTKTLEAHQRTLDTNANASDAFSASLRGINHEYTDMSIRVHDLSDQHRWMGDVILNQIAILNTYKDALDAVKKTYDALSEQATILQDRIKQVQDILNHPLAGTGQYDDLIHQNKMAQDAIQLQIDELLGAGHYDKEPQIEALQAQLNKLKNAADQLNLQKDLDLGDKQYQLDKYAKSLEELPFGTLLDAAKNFGQLSAQERGLQQQIDALKPSLDQATQAYNDQKTKVDALVNSINTVISTDKTLKDDQITVRDAYERVADAIKNVSDVGEQNSKTLTNAARAVGDAQRNLNEVYHSNAEAMQNATEGVASAERGVQSAVQGVQDAHDAMTRASLQNNIDRINSEQKVVDELKAATTQAYALKDAEDAARAAADTAASTAMNDANSAMTAMNNIISAQSRIGAAAASGIPLGATYGTPNYSMPGSGGGTIVPIYYNADGGIRHFDGGGFSGKEDHSAAIYSASTPFRVFAEPETGGEAYIPLSILKREQSLSILGQVADMFGKALVAKDVGMGALGSFGSAAGKGWEPPSWPQLPSTPPTTRQWEGGGASSVTIEEGAVKVEITVDGNAPDDLAHEVASAIENALLHVTQSVTAKVGA